MMMTTSELLENRGARLTEGAHWLSAFIPPNVCCLLVVAKRDESRVPEMVIAGPFYEQPFRTLPHIQHGRERDAE